MTNIACGCYFRQSLLKKLWVLYCNILYNARILWPVFFSTNLLFLIFWKDRYGGFLAMKSSATTPFYCLKFAPFCERHSCLCIVAVCWWKNEAYTDWYYYKTGQERIPVEITISIRQKQWCSGVLGSFLARQQFLPILVSLANLWHFAIFRGSPCPFLFLSVEFCEICYSCYFCHICCPIFSHSMKNSCYFCDFCEIWGLTKALLDLFCFLLFLPYLLLNLFT